MASVNRAFGREHDISRLVASREDSEDNYVRMGRSRETKGNKPLKDGNILRLLSQTDRSASASARLCEINRRAQDTDNFEANRLDRQQQPKHTKMNDLGSAKMRSSHAHIITAIGGPANGSSCRSTGPRLRKPLQSSYESILESEMRSSQAHIITPIWYPANSSSCRSTGPRLRKPLQSSYESILEAEGMFSKPRRKFVIVKCNQAGLQNDVPLEDTSSKEKKINQNSSVEGSGGKVTPPKEVEYKNTETDLGSPNFFEKVQAFQKKRDTLSTSVNAAPRNNSAKVPIATLKDEEPSTYRNQPPKPLNKVEELPQSLKLPVPFVACEDRLKTGVENQETAIPQSIHSKRQHRSKAIIYDPTTNQSLKANLIPETSVTKLQTLESNDVLQRKPRSQASNFSTGPKLKLVNGNTDYNQECMPYASDTVRSLPLPPRSHNIETEANNLTCAPISPSKTIIIDIGHYYVRAGILRTKPNAPEVCFPNVRAFTPFEESPDCLSSVEHRWNTNVKVGEDVLHNLLNGSNGEQEVCFPIRQRQVKEPITPNTMEIEAAILKEIFARLNVKPCEYKVLFCLPTRASSLRPCLISSLFEDFGVREVASLSAFRAVLQNSKSFTCLIINFSSDLEIIPVIEGVLIDEGRVLSSLYIENVLNIMMLNLKESGIQLSPEEILCYGHFIFQHGAFVQNDTSQSKDKQVNLAEYKPCPIERKINIPAHLRHASTEGIFHPEQDDHFDPNIPSLQNMLQRSLKAGGLDYLQELCSNVLLMGEYANLEGLQERIVKEISTFLRKSTEVRVQTIPNPEEAVYMGAYLTATLLQLPQMPKPQWFKFYNGVNWKEMKATVGPFGASLQNRVNADSVWP